MATGIKAAGTDLDLIFEPRTTTKIANVNIKSNGGVDLSNRFEDIASGSAASTTGIKKTGTDLNALFAGIGTVSGPLAVVIDPTVINDVSLGACPNVSDVITGTGSGGAGGYTYAWDWSVGGASITIDSPSNQSTTVRVTAGGNRTGTLRCTVTDTDLDTAVDTISVTIECDAP